MKKLLLITALCSTLFTSCEVYPQDEYEEFYVVESYLVAKRKLPQIRLSKTMPALEYYDFAKAAVSNARVEVKLLESGPQSKVMKTFIYRNIQPGIYIPNQAHKVLPSRTYQLHITFPGSQDVVSAYTIVPGSFRIQPGVQKSVIYQSEEQIELTLSESSYPGRQNIYVFNALAQNPIPENLTPLYAEFYQNSDQPEEDLMLYANNSSGIINAGNFEVHSDATTTLKFPWLGIAFYGENLIVANTIDDNLYDFVRSQSVQLGGSTLSPGEIQNVIYHVDGGIGVFGALASDTVATVVRKGN
jgi:hypothetical protein